jgi:hypothetical protein
MRPTKSTYSPFGGSKKPMTSRSSDSLYDAPSSSSSSTTTLKSGESTSSGTSSLSSSSSSTSYMDSLGGVPSVTGGKGDGYTKSSYSPFSRGFSSSFSSSSSSSSSSFSLSNSDALYTPPTSTPINGDDTMGSQQQQQQSSKSLDSDSTTITGTGSSSSSYLDAMGGGDSSAFKSSYSPFGRKK